MAIGAGHWWRYRRMIHPCAAKTRVLRGYMAQLTRGAVGGHVRGRSAAGRDAVVTRRATADHAVMTEKRARPVEGRMAGVAFQCGLDVRRALALRLYTVVAGRTAAAHFSVIEAHCGTESHRRVAALAAVGTQDVVEWLGCGTHLRAKSVAAGADTWRTLEHCIVVTGFARQVAVLAKQLKSSGQMVKGSAFNLRRGGGRRVGGWCIGGHCANGA